MGMLTQWTQHSLTFATTLKMPVAISKLPLGASLQAHSPSSLLSREVVSDSAMPWTAT